MFKSAEDFDAANLEIMNHYGGPVCIGCGDTDLAVLRLYTPGWKYNKHEVIHPAQYARLSNTGFPPGYRVLCASCNIRAARGLPFPEGYLTSRDRGIARGVDIARNPRWQWGGLVAAIPDVASRRAAALYLVEARGAS